LFVDYDEPVNSQIVQETIKSKITAEFRQASKEALIVNAYQANYVAPAVNVNVVNTTDAPVNTKEVTA